LVTETPKRNVMRAQIYNKLDTLQLTAEKPTDRGLTNLQKRAKAKYLQTPKLYLLLNHATILKDSTKGYQRALNCAETMVYDEDKQKYIAHYCFDRSCNVCNRIRTADLIETYKEDFEALNDPYLVTLTAPNVKADFLDIEIKRMQKIIRKIADNGRKHNILFKGVRKLEITYNIDRADYHPHFHFIVEGDIEAGYLLQKWLIHNPEATRNAQDIRKADKNSLKELFKYAVKETDATNRKKKDIRPIPIFALHHIYKTLKGKRTFQSMGYFAQGIDDAENEIPKIIAQEKSENIGAVLYWSDEAHDYINRDGEKLTKYKPTKKDLKQRNKYEEVYTLSG